LAMSGRIKLNSMGSSEAYFQGVSILAPV
jgi:hypothetical protein